MKLETMAKIIQAEAAKGKDVEQLALGYLEEVSKSNVTLIQRLKRIRCWFRYYHEDGVYKFRYDGSGYCQHCGKVGSGKRMEDGE